MNRHKSEKSHFDIANKIWNQEEKKTKLYRLFRVYHPMYELSVNIDVEFETKEYHIVEKYMDKLVCGYTGAEGNASNRIYVKDKQELFSLLGLEHQGYEVADRYFQDLILAGHFEMTSKGIIAKYAARESVKLQKKLVATTAKEKKLFDAFTMQLMPGVFYDLIHYSCETADEGRQSVWLHTDEMLPNDNVAIDQRIRNFDYVNNSRIERGLPQGYQRMSLASGEEKRMIFLPYYLAIFKENEGYSFQAYRVDNGKEIEWIGDMYETTEYETVREMILRISQIEETCDVDHPADKKFKIKVDGIPSKENGITQIAENGNYEWTLQDWQVQELLSLNENGVFKKKACNMVVKGNIICLTSFEAGKIVYIKKTEKQKEILAKALAVH